MGHYFCFAQQQQQCSSSSNGSIIVVIIIINVIVVIISGNAWEVFREWGWVSFRPRLCLF